MKKITKKSVVTTLKEYLLVTLGAALMVIAAYFFVVPCQIVACGVGGLTNVFLYWFGWQMSITSIAIQIPLLVLSLVMLPKGFSVKTVYACIMYSVFYGILERLNIPQEEPPSVLLWVVFGGVIEGFGVYFPYAGHASNGGSEIVSSIVVSRNPDAKIGGILNIVNFCVYGLGLICFIVKGFDMLDSVIKLVYSVLFSYVVAFVVDSYSQGLDPLLKYYVVTKKRDEVSDALVEHFKRGVTGTKLVKADGIPSDKDMLIVVIPHRQNGKLKHLLKKVDPECFAYCKIIDGVVTRPNFK